MNHDLIKQLQALTPTEGEWVQDGDRIKASHSTLYTIDEALYDDDKLVSLAPTMRTAILEMAKEIEELRSQLSLAHELLKPRSQGNSVYFYY